MDSITQIALGATMGNLTLGHKLGNKAVLWGAVAGTIPDLDVFLVPFFSDIQKISIHRGLSHSIVFNVVLAFVLAWIFYRWKRKTKISFAGWFSLFSLGLITHILLDALTAYGTQLFLPFSDYRVGFDLVSIVDPVYTLPLLAGVFISMFYRLEHKHKRSICRVGLVVSTMYLGFAGLMKMEAENQIKLSLEKQGVGYEKLATIPVSSMSLLWYGVAKTSEGLYIGDHAILDKAASVKFEFFPTNEQHLGLITDAYLVDRLVWFANDFYTVSNENGKVQFYNLQCDMTGAAGEKGEAPTTFYFEISEAGQGEMIIETKMHAKSRDRGFQVKMKRIFRGQWPKEVDN